MQVRNWCRTWGPGLPPAFTGSSLLCFSRRAPPKWLDRQMSVTISTPARSPKIIAWDFLWLPSTSMHRRNRLPRSANLLLPVIFQFSSRLVLLLARHTACRLITVWKMLLYYNFILHLQISWIGVGPIYYIWEWIQIVVLNFISMRFSFHLIELVGDSRICIPKCG